MSLESDSCPGNVEGKQRLTNCFSGGAGGGPRLLHWPAFPEFAVASDACVYPVRLAGEGEAWGGLGSLPGGPFEEARRPQHKEARSVPCGLRRELQETTH